MKIGVKDYQLLEMSESVTADDIHHSLIIALFGGVTTNRVPLCQLVHHFPIMYLLPIVSLLDDKSTDDCIK